MGKAPTDWSREFEGPIDPLVSARLPQPLIDQVEEWSMSNDLTRSEAIRRLVEIGLKARGSPK
jgi:hypothetical protein